MKILVVITRMYVTRGSEDDEFVQNWGQGPKETHEIFDDEDRKILLLHGHKERWNRSNPDVAVSNVISEVRNILGDDLREEQVGLLFHPSSADKEFSSSLKDTFRKNITSVDSIAFTELHSQGEIDSNTSIARLAKAIKEGNEWGSDFEEVWNEYGIDKVLEEKLNILHSCMSPKAARQLLRGINDEWEDIPEEIRSLGNIRERIEELRDYDKRDYFDGDSDYMMKLTDLRDQLLGAS